MVSYVKAAFLSLCLDQPYQVSGDSFKKKLSGNLCIEANSDFPFVQNLYMLLLLSLDHKVSFRDGDLPIGIHHTLGLSFKDFSNFTICKVLDQGCNFLHVLTKLCSKNLEVCLCRIGYQVAFVSSDLYVLHVKLLEDDIPVLLQVLPVGTVS